MLTFRAPIVGLLFASALAFATSSRAVTIDFDGLPTTGPFTGPIAEDGFVYSLHSGGLTGNVSRGNPAPELAGAFLVGGGTLSIVAEQTGTPFSFVGLDIAEFDNNNVGDSTIVVEGFSGGLSVGVEMFTPGNASGLGSFMSVAAASGLLGTGIDELRLFLPSAGSNPFLSNARIDNVVLDNAAAVPEPSAMSLIGAVLFAALGCRSSIKQRQRSNRSRDSHSQ